MAPGLQAVRDSTPALKRQTMPRAKRAAIVGIPAFFVLAVTGSASLGLIQAWNEGLPWHMPGSDWTQSIVFSILILILVFRPEGLLGERTPEGA